ncbi:histone promoter control 2 [Ophiostoma piceae UAMH 11346]|uniref:Histone promoter control 2 n=1 Tax=Ophiostoma piceae (strain UAMH 11346) TaxID=1262450 RepID=S3BV89_OPHP1|nr:histone promoter control 2 [Ophiostoma piceae UAMH 11346]
MNTPIHDVHLNNLTHSTSPDLSSLPSKSPSEPRSPSGHDPRHTSSERFDLFQQQQPYHQGRPQAAGYSMDGVRLTKEGVPRKKPGRKPGTVGRKSGDDITPMTSPGPIPVVVSDIEAPKQKRARKPKDPNAPPIPRKRRAQPSSATGDEMGLSRSSSAHMHFEPKAEFTSMRMDFDPRPTAHPLGPSAILSSTTQPHLHPRKQPSQSEKPPAKRESHQSSVMSILNVDDSPPRPSHPPASTTPVRSVGQSYDPIRSSYDPVRETMFSRDPYGTGPMGSPRAPPQLTNRTSASPSIASLVNPAPVHHNRSPDSSFATAYTQASPPVMTIAAATTSSNATLPARYRDNNASLPPSPSPAPALRATSASTQSSNPPPPPSSILKSGTASSKPSPQVTATKDTGTAISALALSKTSTTKASTTPRSSKAATKADAKATKADAKDESDAQGKPHSKPPPAPPVPASAKSTATKPPTKAAEKRAATAAAKAAAADAKAAAAASKAASKAAASEASSNTSADEPTPKPSGPTTTSFKDVAVSAASSAAAALAAASSAPHIKKFSSILQQERGSKQTKSAASSPKLTAAKGDGQPSGQMSLDSSPQAEPERSILDFGKALPGEENTVPSIVLHIPLIKGETNKYVNFMRMAEERYGWDALHPRLAAHRDRKLRIAAASAALERTGSGRESGDEMTDDMQSGDEGSNEENGAAADTTIIGVTASGPEDAPAKPARKKRIFKEDEYDKDDDFVDDSEMMWEEQAATSRDGFFVYSGPLVPEEEKPAEGTSTPVKRGRGSRGGRGGSTRGGARTATARGAGGPGSRGGGAPRKPRATKQEKEARDREKAELKEASAKAAAAKAAAAKEQPFSSDMAIDDI